MQGWRISMEDSHTTVLDLLAGNPKAAAAHKSKLSFFGVYDGHGGDKVALFAGDNIHNIIAKQDTFKTGNYEQALKDGFLATDRAILSGMWHRSRNKGGTCKGCQPLYCSESPFCLDASTILILWADPKYEDEVSGCTACVGLISEDKIYIVGALLIGEGSDSVPSPPPSPPHY